MPLIPSRLPTEPEINRFTGKTRQRCLRCDKVAYENETKADRAATLISERTPMFAYLAQCGWWHVARFKPRRKR